MVLRNLFYIAISKGFSGQTPTDTYDLCTVKHCKFILKSTAVLFSTFTSHLLALLVALQKIHNEIEL